MPEDLGSGVAKGESFSLTLDFDPSMYEVSEVQVKLRRNATTGLTESAEPQWRWAVQSPFGEGRKKVITSAKASELMLCSKVQSGLVANAWRPRQWQHEGSLPHDEHAKRPAVGCDIITPP